MRPKCIIVTGRPGSGKTTLAGTLAAEICLPLVSRDAMKEGYVNTYGVKHDELPKDTNAKVTKSFFNIAASYLKAGISIVIEAAFQHRVWAEHIGTLSAVGDPHIIVCAIDGALGADRHLQRGLADYRRELYHGDARVAQYRETGQIAPAAPYSPPNLDVPLLEVSTVDEYAPSPKEVIAFTGFKLPNQAIQTDTDGVAYP